MYADVPDSHRQTYLGMVTAMDDAVGEVVAALKETDMWANFPKGSPDIKKTVKKGDNVTLGGEGGGHPQYLFFSPNLHGP